MNLALQLCTENASDYNQGLVDFSISIWKEKCCLHSCSLILLSVFLCFLLFQCLDYYDLVGLLLDYFVISIQDAFILSDSLACFSFSPILSCSVSSVICSGFFFEYVSGVFAMKAQIIRVENIIYRSKLAFAGFFYLILLLKESTCVMNEPVLVV